VPEERVVLRNCEIIDARDIGTYLARDGFRALDKAYAMSPDDVIEEIKVSGLRGRGGAGFPCGLKWELARNAPGEQKYLICNADEGEVGTFKDRYILEHDPFTLIEGMAITGYSIGASKGYIYLRTEYHRFRRLLEQAIVQVNDRKLLKGFDIEIREGAGAYVCGEESALMESIEGKRGEVRYRPPFPPTRGLWGQPTIINNVETLMNIAPIMLNGASWFSQMGTERSKGTKVFSVSGDVARPGVYELVLGSSLRELVQDLAGAERTKVVLVGGATGRLAAAEMMDTPLSFETMLGAGAIMVLDETRDVIEAVHKCLEFLMEESCGKCAPCREGTRAMAEIAEKFLTGEGTEKDIRLLERLSDAMALSSLCGLGQAAPIPVMDSLQHFRDSYLSRMKQKQGGMVR
jgi:NADH-quinone oxidoreductase subunit F